MKNYIIDIETAPLPDAEDRILKLYPFNPDAVKLGNRKDPNKIQEYIEEQRLEHLGNKLDKAQLDPALSYVCAVGIMDIEDADTQVTFALDPDEEKELLLETQARFRGQMTMVHQRWFGWNLKAFDLPYLWMRSWMSRLSPPEAFRQGRYWDSHHVVDLMEEFTFHQFGSYAKLETAAEILGVAYSKRPDDIKGKDFWKVLSVDRDKAMTYLFSDLMDSRGIARVIIPGLQPPIPPAKKAAKKRSKK